MNMIKKAAMQGMNDALIELGFDELPRQQKIATWKGMWEALKTIGAHRADASALANKMYGAGQKSEEVAKAVGEHYAKLRAGVAPTETLGAHLKGTFGGDIFNYGKGKFQALAPGTQKALSSAATLGGVGALGGGALYGMGQSQPQGLSERMGLSTPPSRFGRMFS